MDKTGDFSSSDDQKKAQRFIKWNTRMAESVDREKLELLFGEDKYMIKQRVLLQMRREIRMMDPAKRQKEEEELRLILNSPFPAPAPAPFMRSK
ncbi:hypothetical protein OROMI_004248 [Orobanche minor]